MTLTVADYFCGAGGSSTGMHQVPGVRVVMASNHWQLAVDTHNANFPDADHDREDITKIDPRRHPTTDIGWFSPECTNWSVAKGRKVDYDGKPVQLNLFADDDGEPLPDEAAQRSRMLMQDVPRFTEVHRYRAVIVENVTDVLKWAHLDEWRRRMRNLGYGHRTIVLNSAFASALGPGAPQLRDRVYFVYLDSRVPLWCRSRGEREVIPLAGAAFGAGRRILPWGEPEAFVESPGTAFHRRRMVLAEGDDIDSARALEAIDGLVDQASSDSMASGLCGDDEPVEPIRGLSTASQQSAEQSTVSSHDERGAACDVLFQRCVELWVSDHGAEPVLHLGREGQEAVDVLGQRRCHVHRTMISLPVLAAVTQFGEQGSYALGCAAVAFDFSCPTTFGGVGDELFLGLQELVQLLQVVSVGPHRVRRVIPHRQQPQEVRHLWHRRSVIVQQLNSRPPDTGVIDLLHAHAGQRKRSHPLRWNGRNSRCPDKKVFWREAYPAPDFAKWTRPRAWCPTCSADVRGVYVDKRPGARRTMRYGQQYVYRCPQAACRGTTVAPYVLPAAAVIDWGVPGEVIGARKTALKPKTLARIVAGLAAYAAPLLTPAGGTWNTGARPIGEPMRARTTRESEGLLCPPMLVPVEGRTGKQARTVGEPMRAQTARAENALVIPLRNNGVAKPVDSSPWLTFAAGGTHQALLYGYDSGRLRSAGAAPLPAQTTIEGDAVLRPTARPVDVDACTFRMLTVDEIRAGMAFTPGYTLLGTAKRAKVRMLGNAVTPPAARDLVAAVVEAITGTQFDLAA